MDDGGAALFAGERMVAEDPAYRREYQEHRQRYLLAREFAAGRDVLDVGCGSGYGSQMLAEVARSVVALDVSPEALDYARRVHPADNLAYRVADLMSAGGQLGKHDVVVCFEMIEHVSRPERVMEALRQACKPDGVVLVSTPNVRVTQHASPYHVREFTSAEFGDLCGSAFGSVEIRGQAFETGFARVHALWEAVSRLQRRAEDLERLVEHPWRLLLRGLIPCGLRHAAGGFAHPKGARVGNHTDAPRADQRLPSIYDGMTVHDVTLDVDDLDRARTLVAILREPRVPNERPEMRAA